MEQTDVHPWLRAWPQHASHRLPTCDLHPTVICQRREPDAVMLKYDQFHLSQYENEFHEFWDDDKESLLCPACHIPGWQQRRDALFSQLHEVLSDKYIVVVGNSDFALYDNNRFYLDIEPDGYFFFGLHSSDGLGMRFEEVCTVLADGRMRLWHIQHCCSETCLAEPFFPDNDTDPIDWYMVHRTHCLECDSKQRAMAFTPDPERMMAMLNDANQLQTEVDDLMAKFRVDDSDDSDDY